MSSWSHPGHQGPQEGAYPMYAVPADHPSRMGAMQGQGQGPSNRQSFDASTYELASTIGACCTPRGLSVHTASQALSYATLNRGATRINSHHPVANPSLGKAAAQTWFAGVDSQPNTYGIDHGAQDAHQKAVTYGNAYQTPSQPSYAVDSASQRPEMSWGPTNSASTPALQKNAPAFPLRSPSNPSVPSYTAHSYTSSATYATMAGQSEYERKLAKSDPNLHQAAATRHMPRSAPFPKVEGFSYYGKTPDSTTHPGHFETQLFSLSAPVDAPDFVDLEMAANTSTAYRDVRMSRPQQTTQMAPQNTFPSTLSHRPANAQAYPVASHQPIAPQQPRVSGMQGSYPAHMAQPQNYPTSAPQQHQTPQYAEPPRYSEDMYRAQYAHMQQYGAGYSQASQSTQYAYGPSEGSYSVGYPPHPREGHYGPQATPQATPRSPHSAGSSSDSRSPRSAFSGMEQPSGYQHAQRGEIDEYEASMLPHKRAKQYETIENAPMPSYAPTTSSEGDDTSSDTAGYWTPQS